MRGGKRVSLYWQRAMKGGRIDSSKMVSYSFFGGNDVDAGGFEGFDDDGEAVVAGDVEAALVAFEAGLDVGDGGSELFGAAAVKKRAVVAGPQGGNHVAHGGER